MSCKFIIKGHFCSLLISNTFRDLSFCCLPFPFFLCNCSFNSFFSMENHIMKPAQLYLGRVLFLTCFQLPVQSDSISIFSFGAFIALMFSCSDFVFEPVIEKVFFNFSLEFTVLPSFWLYYSIKKQLFQLTNCKK